MSTETPEREQYTKPTAEAVAKVLAASVDGDYEASHEFWPQTKAAGRVVQVEATPYNRHGFSQTEATARFRALVAEVCEDTVWDGPLDFQTCPCRGRILPAAEPMGELTPELAYAAAAQLIAAAALAQAAIANGGGDQ